MELVILIGLVSAVAAGFACAAEHGHAERHGWGALERLGAGAFTWLVAFAPPVEGAVSTGFVPISVAVLIYGMAWLVIGGMAVGTWLAYQKPIAMPEEDELSARIDRERAK